MNPYRYFTRDVPSLVPRVRWGRVLVWSAQLAILMACVACAGLAHAYAGLASTSAPTVMMLERRAPRHASAPEGVTRLSATDFYITAAYVDHALEQQAELMRTARIVPVTDHGHIVGVALFGIHPGSDLAELGFENGDVLETINDYDMASPERALEAYSRLRTSDWLRVVVDRHGEEVALHYYIR